MRHLRRVVHAHLLLASLLVARSAAADPTLEERLKALEERVKVLEADNAALRAQAAPKPAAPVLAKAAGKETELKVGGLLQIQAEAGGQGDSRYPDDNDRVFLRRARINVSGRFLEEVEWRTEIEMAGTVQNTSALRAQLTDAYLNWRRWERFEIRAGQFKTPFGQEQLSQDARLPFAERSLGSDRLTFGRQLGVQLGGAVAEKRLAWSLGAFNGVASNQSGNDDDRFLVAARLAGVPAEWRIGKKEARWSLGAGGATSRDHAAAHAPDFGFDSTPSTSAVDNLFDGRRSSLGADTQLVLGPFEFDAEWLRTNFHPTSDLPLSSLSAHSWMVQATCFAWKDRLQLGARWDEFDPIGKDAVASTRSWTTGLAWLIKGQDLKLMANWVDVHDDPTHGEESKLIVRVQLVF